jgi:DNA polymerase (family X)
MNPSPTKPRFPREAALVVAGELVHLLGPVCERIAIAGSLRRGKADVGDVEILFVPRMEERPVDMFATSPFSLADEAIQRLLDAGTLTTRPNITGGTTWGDLNKLALHAASGIPVDLFTASEDNWFNYLVCRTGPAESNQRIATAAHNLGWQWNPYGPGFTHRETSEQRACHSEEAVFAFVGLPFHPPELRK